MELTGEYIDDFMKEVKTLTMLSLVRLSSQVSRFEHEVISVLYLIVEGKEIPWS